MVNLKNIENSVNKKDNIAGIPVVVYYAFAEDVAQFPTLPEPDNKSNYELEEYNELMGPFTLAQGKKLYKLYVTPETGEVKSKLVGAIDGKSYKYTLDISHPGTHKQIAGFTRLVKNANLIFLVPDENRPGQYQFMGSEYHPVKLAENEATTGKKIEDYRGRVISLESAGRGECPYLEIAAADLKVLLGEV
jgi:hypothetical protein